MALEQQWSHVCVVPAGVSGQAWATYLPAEKAPADGSKPRGATVFARDFQTVVIYDGQGKFVGVRRPGSALPIQVYSRSDYCLVPGYVRLIRQQAEHRPLVCLFMCSCL